MSSGPSRIAEAVVALFVPPACREEVLGDLHERYRSPLQYLADVLGTVPLVIASRIRRTADPHVLLMQALALYGAFLGGAWLRIGPLVEVFLYDRGLLRLAVPAAATLLGLILTDAYAVPGPRSPLGLVQGPVLGLGLAFMAEAALRFADQMLAVPFQILFYGGAIALPLASAVRLLFPPPLDQLQGIHAPAGWLKRTGGSGGSSPPMGRVAATVAFLVLAWIAYQMWK